jgi:hypothetical protein
MISPYECSIIDATTREEGAAREGLLWVREN